MKAPAEQWLDFAEADLLACRKLLNDDLLTNIVAFHSHQVIEKCFKAIMKDKGLTIPRIHSLSKLFGNMRFEIQSITDRWYQYQAGEGADPADYFRVQTIDGKRYILKHQHDTNRWYLVVKGESITMPG